ncbi:hypothetical protein V6617_01545 [Pelagibacterium nitratireducens]|uniref:Uncharacterized protein n=1 Tax=Pelagibacterium nitratireducens TaxID=1046114 RepID=A0ABZ2I079_9HYPH
MISAERDLATTLADRLIAARILTGTEIADHFGESPRGNTNTRFSKPGTNAQTMCGFHKFPDSDFSKSRTLISVIPGQ